LAKKQSIQLTAYKRIEICGCIASGKTTLATLLSELGHWPTFETFRANPFWADFFSNPLLYAFETEITFLLQHYHSIKMNHLAHPNLVCDFSFVLDEAYSSTDLEASKRSVFDSVRDEVLQDLGSPQLVIHLVCPSDVAWARAQARGRPEELTMDVAFIERLNQAVAQAVDRVAHSTRVLAINSHELDFLSSEAGRVEAKRLVAQRLQLHP